MSTTFTHKGHAVEIVNDRSQNALTYIVMIDGEYAGDINNTMNIAIDQAKAFINRICKPDCHCSNCRPDLFIGGSDEGLLLLDEEGK